MSAALKVDLEEADEDGVLLLVAVLRLKVVVEASENEFWLAI